MPVAISSPISSPSAFQHLLFDLPEPEPPSVVHVRPLTPASPRDLGFGILSHYCGPELIDRVLAQHGRAEQRCRLLPARLVVNAILLMCLKPTVSYQKLMYQLEGAVPASQSWTAPSRSAFAQARQRLGWEVMESLFRAQAMPLAGPAMGCCFWRGRRVMALDGTTFELADLCELWEVFARGGCGSPGSRTHRPLRSAPRPGSCPVT